MRSVIIVQSSNSPKHTLSRLIHSDYFERYPFLIKQFKNKYFEHIIKCEHPKCMKLKCLSYYKCWD